MIGFVSTTIVVRDSVDRRGGGQAGRDLLAAERIIGDAGPIRRDGAHLFAGSTRLDGNAALVDGLAETLGGAVTIFRDDERVATTIRSERRRAIGTRLAPGQIHDSLSRGVPYRGAADVLGRAYYAAYDPLRDGDGRLVGALFVGVPKADYRRAVGAAQMTEALASFAFVGLIGLVAGGLAWWSRRVVEARDRDLEAVNARLDLAIENMSEGLCLYDAAGRLVASNRRYAAIFGVPADAIAPGMTQGEVVDRILAAGSMPPGLDRARIEAMVAGPPAGGRPSESSYGLRDGRLVALSVQPLPDGGWVATHRDITELRRGAARLRHLALHDPLTTLANRTAFTTSLVRRLELAGAAPAFALLLLDVDRLTTVNDRFGHAAGDALLRTLAERLRTHAGRHGLAARLGGDEFALVVEDVADETSLAKLADAVSASLSAPVAAPVGTIRNAVSIGATVIADPQLSADEALGRADVALQAARRRGRGGTELFRPALAAARARRIALEAEMPGALEAGEFELHYQPQHLIATGALTGFEGLLRWRHPRHGLLLPAEFIALAEETGFIVTLGAFVIGRACRDATRWGRDLRVAVNVSAVQLARDRFVEDTIEALTKAALRPDLLELEITETVTLDRSEIATTLGACRDAGLRVALDDFGTGYSSLLYLRQLPFDCLKIDRAFTRDLETAPEAAAIVGAIVQLARTLRATTIAEGVEDESQLHRLRALGCEMAQGFHFGPAVPFEAALALAEGAGLVAAPRVAELPG